MNHLPAPLRPRHDGWTPARQWDFIQALGDTASVPRAAARVGMSVQSAYRLRRHPAAEDFRLAWDAAFLDGIRRLQETALERAIHGETEVYERDGVRITRHRPCAPRLIIALLDRAERLALALAQQEELRAEAAAALVEAETARRQKPVYRDGRTITPAYEPPPPPPVPLSAETPALLALHNLAQGFPDRQGWEGPEIVADDGSVPRLPMPETVLRPASHRHLTAVAPARLRDPGAGAARKAAAAAALEAEAAETEAREAAEAAKVTDFLAKFGPKRNLCNLPRIRSDF